MLKNYSVYFVCNQRNAMTGYNMRYLEGLHVEHCYDNDFAVLYLRTITDIIKAKKLINKLGGSISDLAVEVRQNGSFVYESPIKRENGRLTYDKNWFN